MLYAVQAVLAILVLVIIARLIFWFHKSKQEKLANKRNPFLFDDMNCNLDLDSEIVLERVESEEQVLPEGSSENVENMRLDEVLVEIGPVSVEELEVKEEPEVKANEGCLEITDESEVITLTVMAKPGEPYNGYELLQSLLAAGLRYGEMNVFHRYEEEAPASSKILFSLAQATKPGTFDLNSIGSTSCLGLVLFMDIVGQKDALGSFNLMLDTAKQLCEDLGGNVYDEERKILTPGSVARFKARILSHKNGKRKS